MRKILFLAACVLLSSCGGDGSTGASNVDVDFKTVALAQYSGISQYETIVVTSQAQWQSVWSRHTANASPPAEPPVIDFAADEVVGVALGARPNGCYSVEVTRVLQASSQLIVRYRENVPTPTSLCTQAVVHPVHLVAVPRAALPIAFQVE